MSEPRQTEKDGGGNSNSNSNRGKRPPRGGGSNSQGGGRGNGFKRTGTGNSGNRDSDSQASDASTKRRSNSGRGRGGGPGGRRPSRPGSATQPSPKVVNHPPMPSDGESSALSNLQKVITDLKSMPASSQGQPQSQPQTQNQVQQASNQVSATAQAAPTAPTYAQTTQSNLTPTAPPFQPSFAPGEVPPRHRKAQSMGPTPTGPAAPAGYGMGGYAPYLDSMNEDIEPQGPESPMAPTMNQYSNRPPMGSFQAPRFANMQQAVEAENVGPSGRPQLAPSFSFGGGGGGGGAKRRTNSMSVGPGPAIGEEDAGFQFPQQNQQPRQQNQQDTYDAAQNLGGSHRRTGSEIMSQQIALQNQIEALQAQQQQLLQQHLATNQVMSSSISAPALSAQRSAAHRRIQSQQVSPGGFQGGFQPPAPAGGFVGGGMGLDQAPKGHGRRHSVNVLNKGHASQPSQFFSYSGVDEFDENFQTPANAPPVPTQHNRNASRADSSWRINGGAGAIQAANGYQADLAQAQAQLQSLAQFRAASGGHHAKMPSFSFPNMLPNMMAANMMGLGGLNLLQQQQQQFQMQLQQQNQPQRKSLFAPYLPQASLPPLLAAGKLVVGILRVNKRNRSDAYVATEVLDADIYICGSKDRNRALEGDIVAVELLNVDEVWATKKEKEEKKRKKEENAAYDIRSPAGRKNEKKKDDVEVEGQGLGLFEDEEVTDEIKPQFAGHVVAVVERMPGQLFSGTLGLLRPSSVATKEKQEAERREREGDRGDEGAKRVPTERPKIVWFKPTDKRVPLIAIPTEQAPSDFVENAEAYADRLFVACIKRHPISSLHPFGTLVEELGPIGNVEVETSALLKDCNFPTEDFSDNVLKCLPPLPWSIPERELETRKDLRDQRIFSIDPPTAKDIDDALSITKNDDGTYDVGIHIADVSYFVKPNTALDRDARKRSTSVYLVQRAVPMLPPALSEQLCSLVAGEERLAFSVVLTLTEDARIIKKWFGRTIVKSSAKLAYGDAQKVIEGGSLPDVSSGHEGSAIAGDITVLHKLAKHLRQRRFQNGALRIQSDKLMFDLDEEGLPLDCYSYEYKEANMLIEEFMLLANFSVAQQIAVHLPEQALLRRHDEPLERRLNSFAERAAQLGYEMDISSAGALQHSFSAVTNPEARRHLEQLAVKAMQTAKYFCAGMLDIAKYQHYALNSPLYTHFTSPIRRYADVMVHRQLDAVLSPVEGEIKFSMDRDSVAKVAQHCNIKKDMAKLAQEQSAHLYLCFLIADLTQRYGPVIRQARVVSVHDAAFDVVVPEFSIEKRVHIDQIPIDNHVYDEHNHILQIYWSERDVISWLAENSDDEHLKKVKQTAEQHALKMEVASRSVNDESALFEDDADDEQIMVNRTGGSGDREASKQRLISLSKAQPKFEGLRVTTAGHRIQDIKELMSVPVIVTADLAKSPPVIKVYACNPYSKEKAVKK
ncbi:hypothetical protein FRC14_003877 [Serendipita sp. 396]|nr:hypothetical protein FRC14_003877 [Serendipita sp. 396]KAG8789482.1 hypothetical protein FRC15_008339 [Serendipita sp. 397]KAG8804714.1 hypothetical protein FRC16_003604 [Serendipita sp. 398]KAG8879068.1 hypothetical protein FRC20_003827 [Serendipita sp. 405]